MWSFLINFASTYSKIPKTLRQDETFIINCSGSIAAHRSRSRGEKSEKSGGNRP